jgi:NADH-quinone oxidoreductase subunit A
MQLLHFAIFVLVCLAIAGGIPIVSALFGKREPNAVKDDTYECGLPPLQTARVSFPLRYVIVALLFILFDVEVAFIYPWAVLYRELGALAIAEMGAFMFVLVVGLAYVWKRGGLNWE